MGEANAVKIGGEGEKLFLNQRRLLDGIPAELYSETLEQA